MAETESTNVKKTGKAKKADQNRARDRTQMSSSSQDHDDPNRTPEPYVCGGHFQTEFTELCRRNNMSTIPGIHLRAKRPATPPPQPAVEEKAKISKKGDIAKNQAPPPEPEPQPIIDVNYVPPPKTYTMKDKFEYFKPAIYVEMDNPDKQETVTEIYVRGWKLESPILTVFQQCLPKIERLHTVDLWHCGLTDETLEQTASIMRECSNLKHLVLDNNPTPGENYHLFLKEESPVQFLSLRYNSITDKGASLLGEVIGSLNQQNQKLLSLNLTGNKITDAGAKSLAQSLRLNRTLLSLNLANNDIGNTGARKLAEVISRFPMTHDEIVARRKLLAEKGTMDDRKLSSPTSRRADSRDREKQDTRPASVRSNHAIPPSTQNKKLPKSGGKGGKETKGKDEDKDKDKHDKGGKAKKEVLEKEKKQEKKGSIVGQLDPPKGTTKKVEGRKKRNAPSEQEFVDTPEVVSPLLDKVDYAEDKTPLLAGNRALINLGLAYNHIDDDGLKFLLDALNYQSSRLSKLGNNHGLLRINIHKNKFSDNSPVVREINAIIAARNPLQKPTGNEQENHT